jgi:transposase
VCVVDGHRRVVCRTASPPDLDGLRGLAERLAPLGPMAAAIESMTGARFVHDRLEELGWQVQIADAQKVKGLAPLACKTDKIDARVLAELAARDLVPAIWLPDPAVRGARERARYRQHLVKHRTQLKNRVHATLMTFGQPRSMSDLFGAGGRRLLAELGLPEPWASTMTASVVLIDDLDAQIAACERQLRELGAEHPYVSLLQTVPGIAWVLGYTIAAEIGDIARFGSPKKLVGYTGLCPRVYQSGSIERRGAIAKNGPTYLRWALIEAAMHAARSQHFKPRYQRTASRLGGVRGRKVARTELARELATCIWHMLTRNQSFAPAGPVVPLAA